MQSVKISQSSFFVGIRFKISVMFNGVNLQRGNVFILVFVIYIAIEIIVIMSSIRNFIIAQPYMILAKVSSICLFSPQMYMLQVVLDFYVTLSNALTNLSIIVMLHMFCCWCRLWLTKFHMMLMDAHLY